MDNQNKLVKSDFDLAYKLIKIFVISNTIEVICVAVAVALHMLSPFNTIILILVIAGNWAICIWCYVAWQIKLNHFSIQNIQNVGAVLGADWRDKVWAKGTLTFHEWIQACKKAGFR